MDFQIENNKSYLLKDLKPENAYKLFSSKINSGLNGLCISRKDPRIIKQGFNLIKNYVWLSNKELFHKKSKDKSLVLTNDLSEIKKEIHNFTNKNNNSIILLDRFDYLVNIHGFQKTIQFLYDLNDSLLNKNSTFILNVDSNTLSKKEIYLLEKELEQISFFSEDIELEDDLHEIIDFINTHEKVAFKNVSKHFNITKTTTRRRIKKLFNKKLIKIKRNGRHKIVRLTEKGKSLL